MKSAVIVFPGSNCDRDAHDALALMTGSAPSMVWHRETDLPAGLDLIMVPGGFSYGDYLRSGAIAGRSPVMREVAKAAEGGTPVLGVCNGFQVLTETGLLPGALLRNAGLHFVCKTTPLRVETIDSPYTNAYSKGQRIEVPVAHHDGNYLATPEELKRLEGEDRVAFRYLDNPNGSVNDIAGILSRNRRVLGLMPHPERASDPALGRPDGAGVFASLQAALSAVS